MQLRLWDSKPEHGKQPITNRLAFLVGWITGIVSLATLLVMMTNFETSPSEDELSGGGFGTGFVVTADGHVLTNAHVAAECGSITAKIDGNELPLTLLGTDDVNDLAVLKLAKPTGHFASLRGDDVHLAEPVIVTGFPMRQTLSSSLHATDGLVSNLAAMDNDASSFQVSAPIQSGNSGSPVLDQTGSVVGIVFGMVDAAEMLEESEELPQNVNFAVRASVIRSFLAAHDVQVDPVATFKERDTVSIVSDAKLYTLALTCEAD